MILALILDNLTSSFVLLVPPLVHIRPPLDYPPNQHPRWEGFWLDTEQ